VATDLRGDGDGRKNLYDDHSIETVLGGQENSGHAAAAERP